MNSVLMARQVVSVKEKEEKFNDHSGEHQSWGSWQPLLNGTPRLVAES